jgi:hypothetical protein
MGVYWICTLLSIHPLFCFETKQCKVLTYSFSLSKKLSQQANPWKLATTVIMIVRCEWCASDALILYPLSFVLYPLSFTPFLHPLSFILYTLFLIPYPSSSFVFLELASATRSGRLAPAFFWHFATCFYIRIKRIIEKSGDNRQKCLSLKNVRINTVMHISSVSLPSVITRARPQSLVTYNVY